MNRGIFNFQQICGLTKFYTIEAIVPIAWTDFSLKSFNINDLKKIEINSIPIRYLVYVFIPRITVFLNGISMCASILLSKFFYIKKFKPDCIFTSWAYPDGFSSVLIGSIFKIPVITQVLGTDINVFAKNPLIKNQIAWTLKKSDAIISVSQELKNEMIQLLGIDESKIHVVYRGVNKQLFKFQNKSDAREKLNLSKDKYIILFVGNLIVTKGCMELFYAVKESVDLGYDIQLVLIGSGQCTELLNHEIKKFSLEENVVLAGQIGHKAIPDWMSSSDVLCLPSHNEGVPNVVVEAISCGTPVIATRVGGIPEIVNSSNGILVESQDHDSLVKAICSAFNKKWQPEKILTSVQGLTIEKSADKIHQILDLIIEKH
jgi:glycosyltransferase involved in cell wall biosynthesis